MDPKKFLVSTLVPFKNVPHVDWCVKAQMKCSSYTFGGFPVLIAYGLGSRAQPALKHWVCASCSSQWVGQNFRWDLKLLPMTQGILLEQASEHCGCIYYVARGSQSLKFKCFSFSLRAIPQLHFFISLFLCLKILAKEILFIYPEAGLDKIKERLLSNQPGGRKSHFLF